MKDLTNPLDEIIGKDMPNSMPFSITDLTKKQAEFVKEYIETGNGTQSALEAYDTDNPRVAAAIASENLTKPNIQKYLESIASKAATRIEQLMEQSENLTVALGASKDIMDRAGFKPVERNDVTTNGKDMPTPIIQLPKTE